MEKTLIWGMVCLYLLVAAWVLAENVCSKHVLARPSAVARDVLAALIWPLVLLPWREWPAQVRQWWQAVPVRYGAIA